MAIPAEFNSRIDKNVDYVFDWQFTEDNETPIPVDTWSFEFLLKDPLGTTIWDVINADFGRPSTGRITFTKTIAEIAASGTWEYVGYCDIEKRKKLMARAVATFTPTEYLECFAGTHIESMLHGTPPITTNFGVFPGTIPDNVNGIVGFRCNTLQDFVDAAIKAKEVNHYEVREYGERFLMDNVKWEFESWFQDLYKVYESAIDHKKKGWHRLNNKKDAIIL